MSDLTGMVERQACAKFSAHRKLSRRDRWVVLLLTPCFGNALAAQSPISSQAAPTIVAETNSPHVTGEVRDPCLRVRWQVIADRFHPERPGRLVPVQDSTEPGPLTTGVAIAAQTPVIQSGAAVTVFQSTLTVNAQFQAFAMEPARLGHSFRARLVSPAPAGGSSRSTVISVVATGPKTATWGEEVGVGR